MVSKDERDALHGIDDRISLLEKRLDNAKAARDAYIQHLRGRYPNWRPPLPSLSYPEARFDFPRTNQYPPSREPLLSRLATSDYQWDVETGQKTAKNLKSVSKFSNFPPDIPLNGPLLEGDLRRSRIRLKEISDELKAMRMDRMSLSTDQWMLMEPFRQNKSLRLNLATDPDPPIDYLEEAAARLATIDFTHTSPVETPTEERKMEIQMDEQHQKMMEDMRSGVIPMTSTLISEPILKIPAEIPKFPEIPAEKPAEIPPVHVHFQETPVAPPTSTVTQQDTPILAPPTNTVANLFGGGSDSEDSDNFRGKPPQKPPTDNAISSFLSNFASNRDDSDSDEFSRPSNAFSRPATQKPKSTMFANDSDGDDDFFD